MTFPSKTGLKNGVRSVNKKDIKKIDSYLVTSLLTGMMDGLILEYSFLDKEIDSEKVSDQIISIIFKD